MEKHARIEAYFEKENPFREGLGRLRKIVLKTALEEDLKWGAPVYTHNGTNVLGIMAFKAHFGLWFFNGVFLTDPLNTLENAQEGKTKAMRHWKFTRVEDVDARAVSAYVKEAIRLAEQGVQLPSTRKKVSFTLPPELEAAFESAPELRASFDSLAPYKQRDFAEHIRTAKQAATKARRLAAILPLIRNGVGLNDKYQKG